MAGTRSSTRNSANSTPSTQEKKPDANGSATKRKANAGSAANSPAAKRARQDVTGSKKQKSLEESMDGPGDEEMAGAAQRAEEIQANGGSKENGSKTATKDEPKDEKMADAKTEGDEKAEVGDDEEKAEVGDDEEKAEVGDDEEKAEAKEEPDADEEAEAEAEAEPKGEDKAEAANGDETASKPAESASTKMQSTGEVSNEKADAPQASAADGQDGAVQVSSERAEAQPSSILEKGIIYFFSRARVGIEQPEGAGDIARSYMVLRPLPAGASLGDGAIEDKANCRLLALPKKVLPKSHSDVFMSFVEKSGATVEALKDEFMAGSSYSTKTTGSRHTPPVTPIGEGIYALTATGNSTHLAYMLTIPAELGEVQEEMGLALKGSFALSVKNPDQKGPANASLDNKPEFPQEIMDEFRGLRWAPLQPKHLEYPNAQFLLIGEAQGELGKAVEASAKDEKHGKEKPEEEMEKLEEEDSHRVEPLKGDHQVFEDLGISHKEFPKLKTTW